jgi:hypothetical protein
MERLQAAGSNSAKPRGWVILETAAAVFRAARGGAGRGPLLSECGSLHELPLLVRLNLRHLAKHFELLSIKRARPRNGEPQRPLDLQRSALCSRKSRTIGKRQETSLASPPSQNRGGTRGAAASSPTCIGRSRWATNRCASSLHKSRRHASPSSERTTISRYAVGAGNGAS